MDTTIKELMDEQLKTPIEEARVLGEELWIIGDKLNTLGVLFTEYPQLIELSYEFIKKARAIKKIGDFIIIELYKHKNE